MPPARKLLTIERIRAAVARRFNVPESLLVSKRRTQEVAIARQVVMYLARTLTGMSLKAIGRALGGRDHSTVIHAVKLVRDTMDINGDFRCQVDETITDLHREAA
jgi:chromosomal replication initiator protein